MKKIAIWVLYIYKLAVSPFLVHACRFRPTCSEYSKEAIERLGIIKGGYLGIKRIAKCHPWGKSGYDPVPGKNKGL